MEAHLFIRDHGLALAYSVLRAGTAYLDNGMLRVSCTDGAEIEVNFNELSELVKSHIIINGFGGLVPALEETLKYKKRGLINRQMEVQAHIDNVRACL